MAILALTGMSACAEDRNLSENDLALSEAEYEDVGSLLTQAGASSPVMSNYRGLGIETVSKMGGDYCALVVRFGADDATPAYHQLVAEQAGISAANILTLAPIAVGAAAFMCADDISDTP
ncbi:hypothetical protein [uncultured Ilumatobacter sp.]|uniref:hypothetical protein n=1 Tax=uncultured Ilumatobacter sp. TaxID=879968 RepID=UPI00374ED7A6